MYCFLFRECPFLFFWNMPSLFFICWVCKWFVSKEVKKLHMTDVVLIFEAENYRASDKPKDFRFDNTLVLLANDEKDETKVIHGSCGDKNFEYYFNMTIHPEKLDRLRIIKRDRRRGTLNTVNTIDEAPVELLHFLSNKKALSLLRMWLSYFDSIILKGVMDENFVHQFSQRRIFLSTSLRIRSWNFGYQFKIQNVFWLPFYESELKITVLFKKISQFPTNDGSDAFFPTNDGSGE